MKVSKGLNILSYEQSIEILSQYSIQVAEGHIAKSSKEAAEISKRMGYPVALKVLAPQVSHKTEAKALKLDIKTESELVGAYDEVIKNAKQYDPKVEIQGVLVQEMLDEGTEVIVGISRDAQFGPVILFGLGGIFVEVLKDVSLRVPPITKYDAEDMIREIKGYRVLEGFRGKPKSDVKAIVDILLKVSKLSLDLRESILEMDLNPIIVQADGGGASVVDVRIVASREMGIIRQKDTKEKS